jgi:Ca2+-binding EF-hand superfamily protein
MSPEEVSELFRNVDINGTGDLEYSEFVTACLTAD